MATESKKNAGNKPNFKLQSVYVRDVSFESPNAPKVFFEGGESPKIGLNLNVKLQKLNDDGYEVALYTTVVAEREKTGIVFMVEVVQAGIFVINPELKDAERKEVLSTECVQALIPFLRRQIADLTRDGGFPPLLIDPVISAKS